MIEKRFLGLSAWVVVFVSILILIWLNLGSVTEILKTDSFKR